MGSKEVVDLQVPVGYRKILVVEDDNESLQELVRMLEKLGCEATPSGSTSDALKLLSEQKDGFEVLICAVNKPAADGLKLLQHVSQSDDLNLLIVAMSDGKDKEISRQCHDLGAQIHIRKPPEEKELRRIWRHLEKHHCQKAGVNRDRPRDVTNKSSSGKAAARLVWSEEYTRPFNQIVEELGGLEKATPKKIHEKMNMPELTPSQVGSHLQKVRELQMRKDDEQLTRDHSPSHLQKNSSKLQMMRDQALSHLQKKSRELQMMRDQAPSHLQKNSSELQMMRDQAPSHLQKNSSELQMMRDQALSHRQKNSRELQMMKELAYQQLIRDQALSNVQKMSKELDQVPSHVQKKRDLEMRKEADEPKLKQRLTMCYDGKEHVYENVNPKKVEAIMILLSDGNDDGSLPQQDQIRAEELSDQNKHADGLSLELTLGLPCRSKGPTTLDDAT